MASFLRTSSSLQLPTPGALRRSSAARVGAGYHIELRDESIKRHIRGLNSGAVVVAQMRALNAALGKANTLAKRAIAKKRNLKSSTAGKQLKAKKASPTRLIASIEASGQPIRLIDTKGTKTQTRGGVKANPGTGRRLFRGAFLARYKGRLGVYERVMTRNRAGVIRLELTSPTTGRRYLSEFPIREIRLPSVPATLAQRDITRAIDLVVDETYGRELLRQVELANRRAGR